MSIYVMVQQAEGVSPPGTWNGDSPLDPLRLGAGEKNEWQKLCRLILEWAQTEPLASVEVCLCLLGDELVAPPDRSLLGRLLTLAREHTWGAKLFLVAHRKLSVQRGMMNGRESLQKWMETAVRGRTLDLLQVDYKPRDPSSIRPADLRGAVDRADGRHRILANRALPQGSWRCVLHRERKLLERLLSPLVQTPRDPEQAPNLLVVVDSGEPSAQKAMVHNALRRYPGRSYLVAALRRPTKQLTKYCSAQRLGEPLELHGDFELWYLLLRLNERSQRPAVAEETSREVRLPTMEGIRPVSPDEKPVFHPAASDDLPEIVVTSAFNPNEEMGYYLDAARDIGRFIEHSPLGLRFVVEPAVNLGRLIRAVGRRPEVWIHLGHGDDQNYLAEADTEHGEGRLVSPQMWLDCFQIENHRLALAIFLTCRSATIAERFARAGAGVAVGFGQIADSDKCRELAVQILKSVVEGGTAPEVVLEGFRRGYYAVSVQEEAGPSKPVAFFPERP